MTADPRSPRPLALVVLAAGRGTRLATSDDDPPKVLVECLGVPLLEHVRRAVAPLAADVTLVVVGHGAAAVRAFLDASWSGARPILQEPQNGTGHATRLALEALARFEGDVLVVSGDVPQVRTSDLETLREHHRARAAAATFLTGLAGGDAGRLGRVVRDAQGQFERVVEAKDALGRPDLLALREFNTGLYAFDAAALRPALARLSRANAQGEEYLTDVLGLLRAAGQRVEALPHAGSAELLGVNTHSDLAQAFRVLRLRVLEGHLERGVAIVDLDSTVVEVDVDLARGARLLPFTYVQRGSRVESGAVVGPFARLRGKTVIGAHAEIGNFVEVKASTVGAGAKAKHLTYLGDATVGPDANIGCGTITANFDGSRKHATEIGAKARIGAGTVLVAPVKIGAGAVTGANAVVTAGRDVAPGQVVVGVPARPLAASGGDPRQAPAASPAGSGPRAARAAAQQVQRERLAERASRGGARGQRDARRQEARRAVDEAPGRRGERRPRKERGS